MLQRFQRADSQRTEVHNAAKGRDDLRVEYVLEESYDVNIRAADGMTALHLAAEAGNDAVIRTLLE